MEVINPDDVFIWGASYELPVYYGLLDKKFLNEQKMSTTFSDQDFARESCSIWTGGTKESWFDPKKLAKIRSLLNYEKQYSLTDAQVKRGCFYLMSVDVARYGGNDTSIFIIKVSPREETNWIKRVVYTENINKMSLPQQASRIKELYAIYQPKEIIVDGNGIGGGLVDELVMPSMLENGMQSFPLYVKNDPSNYPVPIGEEHRAVIFNMKANAAINSEIYSNLYIQLNSDCVKLLADERVIKEKLLTTQKGQKMDLVRREKFLMPYIMTSRLIDELNNLRLKVTGAANQVTVEQISKRINKDRVSALSYGLYRIKFFEDQALKKKRQKNKDLQNMIFFSRRNKK